MSNLKYVSIGSKYECTTPCANSCVGCPMMSGKNSFLTNGKKYKTEKGNCKTRNLIYGATCKTCDKMYVGRTTQLLLKRIYGHRSYQKQYSVNQNGIDENSTDIEKDRYSLAIHLHKEHSIMGSESLDDNYKFTILEKCTPKSIDVKEHFWIQKLRTITPHGLNLNSPLGLPLL